MTVPSPLPRWLVLAPFRGEASEFDPVGQLCDERGAPIIDSDGTTIEGMIDLPIDPGEPTGVRSFDALVMDGVIGVNFYALTTTIASGSSVSDSVPLQRRPVVGIYVPIAWTEAVLTFQTSEDGVTFVDVVDETGARVTLTPGSGAGAFIRVGHPDAWTGMKNMRIRSGTASSPVTQASTVVLTVVVRDI